MQLVFRTQGCPVAISRDDDVTQVSIELDAEVTGRGLGAACRDRRGRWVRAQLTRSPTSSPCV